MLTFVSFDFDRDVAAHNYVEYYKELAIVEMYRTGIPASITIAQGLHESNYGTSPLAQQANNHFGIKCKSYWIGKTYFHKDDDFDKKGNLLESCFRAYDTDIDSYIDRSNFLKESSRYSVLFSYSKTDYVSWAHGLQKCGYATDTEYANKLIKKIEKYELYKLDFAENPYDKLMKKKIKPTTTL